VYIPGIGLAVNTALKIFSNLF